MPLVGDFLDATGDDAGKLPIPEYARFLGNLPCQTYTFYANSDDGVRVWVNGQHIINRWSDHALAEYRGSISLTAGQEYSIKVEYYEHNGQAVVQLRWNSASQAKQIIPQGQLYTK